MAVQIQLRRDTAANWTSTNPTLAQGEAGFETNTGKLKLGDGTTAWNSLAYFASGISDGDKGDITVSSSGTVLTIDNDVVTYAKMQNVSATDKVLGRSTAGAGDVEEITMTAAGRALIDDADAAAMRTTLGLVIGTNVQAYDAELAALAGLTSAADSFPYFTGSGTAALLVITSAIRTVLASSTVNAFITALASTTSALGVGTIELGHATDTTLSRASAGQLAVEGVNVLMNGGALGTPSSGTLTNATGLPIAGLVASTVTALGVGSIELGHASDTTVSRASAGDIQVEGNRVFRVGGADVPVADGGTGSSSSGVGGALGNLGMQVVTTTTGSISATSSADVTVTWGTAWADTNYTVLVSAELNDATGRQPPYWMIRTNGTNKSTTSVVVRVFNTTAVSLNFTIRVIGIHD